MSEKPNRYVGATSPTEEGARTLVQIAFGDIPGKLVHKEPPTDEAEEYPTWVFESCAEPEEELELEYLYDHFELPNLENLPYEEA